MADPTSPFTALVDPPLAPPPTVADLEQRARGLRHRRRIARGISGAAAVLAIAGLATVVTRSGPDQIVVHGGGDTGGVEYAPNAPSGLAGPIVVGEFAVAGQTWQLVASAGTGKPICLDWRTAGADPVPAGCWPLPSKPMEAVLVKAGGATFLSGLTTIDVTRVDWTDTGSVVQGTTPTELGLPFKVFGGVIDGAGYYPFTAPLIVTARTTAGTTYPLTLPAPVDKTPPITAVPVVPPATKVPPQSTTTTPASSGPPTTSLPPTMVPPADGALKVTVVPNATDLRKQRFDSATAIDGPALLVRFEGGVCGDVIGKVDVAESAQTVTVTLWAGYMSPRPTGACPALAVFKEIVVPIKAPLGNRAVVDGAA